MKMIRKPDVDIRYLDDRWLDCSGRLKLMPAEVFRRVPREDLIYWCYMRGRYLLPTKELIDWLHERIGGRTAIELAAGNGDLGYLLGIRETDSYLQQRTDQILLYREIGQAPTNPPKSVIQMEAVSAVKHYKPQVAVAAWLTRKFDHDRDRIGLAQASIYGAREEEIFERVEAYIHIGNEAVHGQKTLRALPHEQFKFPWLVSRAERQELDVIYVWDNFNSKGASS